MAKKPKKPVAPPPELTGEKRATSARQGVPPKEYYFKPGNPGRPKGARNKLGEEFLEALHTDFKENGKSAIRNCRLLKPDVYVRVIGDLLRKEIVISREDEAFDKLSDNDLNELLADVIARRRHLEAQSDRGADEAGATAAARKGKPGRVH